MSSPSPGLVLVILFHIIAEGIGSSSLVQVQSTSSPDLGMVQFFITAERMSVRATVASTRSSPSPHLYSPSSQPLVLV